MRFEALLLVSLVGSVVPLTSAQEGEDELLLDGLIVAADPSESIALVRRAVARRAVPLNVGDRYGGYVLVEVSRKGAVFQRGDVRIHLTTRQAKDSIADDTPKKSEAPVPWRRERAQTSVRRIKVRRDAYRLLREEFPDILRNTRVKPLVIGDYVEGVEILRLPDDTILSDSGLLVGDVIRSVNEQPVYGFASLVKALSQSTEELRLVIARNGEVLRFAYIFP